MHRAIKACLKKEIYNPGNWEDIGAQCSKTERRADDATRDVVAWLKCYYMQDKIGEAFDGVISAVVSFGVFVALNDVFVEGLVHVSELGQDYFHFDAARHQMTGERTAKRYRLGDKVRVQIARVDLETTRIDFSLLDNAAVPAAFPKMGPKPASPASERGATGERHSTPASKKARKK